MTEAHAFRDRFHGFVEGRASAAELANLSQQDLIRIAQLAIATLAAGRLEEATEQLELLVALQPDLYLPYHYLGLIALRRGRFDVAVLLLDHAAALLARVEPRSPALEKLRQEIRMIALDAVRALNRLEDAEERTRELLALGPKLDRRIGQELAKADANGRQP